jgi:hypothetical protein
MLSVSFIDTWAERMSSIKSLRTIGWILALVGWGITIHAVASELYHKGGYSEILSFQGEWIGLTLIAIAYGLLLLHERHI